MKAYGGSIKVPKYNSAEKKYFNSAENENFVQQSRKYEQSSTY